MTVELATLLRDAGVSRAVIVDDAYDRVPTSADLRPEGDEWANFFDDLGDHDKALLRSRYPNYDARSPADLSVDDAFVRIVWDAQSEISPEAAGPLLARYISDQASDRAYLYGLEQSLSQLGLEVQTAGRDFAKAASWADIAFVDLFLGSTQDEKALKAAIEPLRGVVAERPITPPLVVLMSRNDRLRDLRDVFRDEVGLQESAFRIISKGELAAKPKLHLTIERLAAHQTDSRAVARFIHTWSNGIAAAGARTVRSMRRLDLAAHAHIREVLLRYEGQPTGSYMLDVFDRVLQHELESDSATIAAANGLAGLSAERYPPPYISKSPDLQSLVFKTLFQNRERLKLSGAECSEVAFGDVLQVNHKIFVETPSGTTSTSRVAHLPEVTVLLVITPACDLARRGGAKRVLMLVGEMATLTSKSWRYKPGRTSIIEVEDGVRRWIEWDLKHVMSLTPEETSAELSAGTLVVLARMRESPALELQQRLLSDLGRVGQVAPMPATFSVGVAVHYLDVAGRPALLPTPTLDADGGICWVGRDDIGSQKLRLSLGEDACDQVCAALQAVDPDQLYPDVRALVASLLSSGELLTLLAAGVELPLETDTSRRPLQLATAANTADGGTKSSTPQPKVVGIITRNLQPNVVLKPKEAATTAILIVVGDLIQDGATPAETF